MKKYFLLTLLVLSFTGIGVAQEEVLEEGEDFVESNIAPPPPPPPGSGTTPSPRFRGSPPSRFDNRNSGSPSSTRANPSFNTIKKRNPKAPDLSKANIEDITNENYPDLIESFDFPNADIADVVKAISELTGKNFIIDPGIRGKITIIAPTQITVAEAYKAFLSALAINNYSIVPSGKFLKIKPSREAQRDSIEIYSGAYTPNTDQMITRVLHLKYIPASEMQKFTSKLSTKDGTIEIYEPTNTLIISDYGTNIQRIMKIVAQLDVRGFEEQLTVIPIRYAKAKSISDLIEQIINKDEKKTTRRRVPRFGRNRDSGSNQAFSLVIPDERTNSIIVVGNKTGTEKIRNLVRKLDYPLSAEDAGGAYVYYVKYGEAEKMANTLNGVAKAVSEADKQAGGSTTRRASRDTANPATTTSTGPSGNALFGGDVKITADKDTNSLVIIASKQDYKSVLNLLKKIDIPRDQVYVETIIMEMAAGDKSEWGASVFKFASGTDGIGRTGYNTGNFSSMLNIGKEGAILGFANGGDVTIDFGSGEKTIKSLMGLISFLKTNNTVNVLSTPQILAMDNEEAEIEVGSTIPVGQTTTAIGDNPQTSIDREDATIKLNITPFISPSSDSVRLKIKQSIKQLSEKQVQAEALANSAVTTDTRSLNTNIVVRDGDTAVLGGLMRDQESENINKIPVLGDIPILGWLFKSKATSVEKVNLLVFITPKIIRNAQDSNILMGQKLDERLNFIRNNMRGRDKHGAVVDAIDPRNPEYSQAPAPADYQEDLQELNELENDLESEE